jgi:hypothetical protein
MGHLTDEERAKVLGLNSARFFNFDIDRLLRYREEAAAQA